MDALIAGKTVNLNEQGYLTEFSQWDKDIAQGIANEDEVGALTDRHWAVISWLQEQYKNEVPLTIRKVGKSGVTDIKEFYTLFPGGPLKKATRIAGIPKPVGCI